MKKSVFVFSTAVAFMQNARDYYGERAKPISLAIWARKLGYKSARSLEMVISGKRLPSEDLVFKISKDLKLSEKEKTYFQLLVKRERAIRHQKPAHEIEEEMNRLRPVRFEAQYISNEVFQRVSEWYPLVIRQLAKTPQFKKDIRWIAKKLRGKATESQIAAALAEWENLALGGKSLYTKEDVPSQAVRTFHKKMLHKAIEAIDEIDVEEREVISMTFRSSKKNIPQIKKTLREIRDQLNVDFDDSEGNEVLQLSIVLFPHTNLEK